MSARFFTVVVVAVALFACQRKSYPELGENIYRTGKNLSGKHLLDKHRSQIKFIKSCQGCHGGNGRRIPDCNIQWSQLARLPVPYTDSLFSRFLDEDLKSDGSSAKTGVHWEMTAAEKQALVAFLKTLGKSS